MRTPRNVKAPRAGVDGEVIPSAVSAHLIGFDYVISRTSRSDRDRCQGQAEYGNPPLRIQSHDFLLINFGCDPRNGAPSHRAESRAPNFRLLTRSNFTLFPA